MKKAYSNYYHYINEKGTQGKRISKLKHGEFPPPGAEKVLWAAKSGSQHLTSEMSFASVALLNDH